MTECRTISMIHKKLCAGDLDRRILIKSRANTTGMRGVDIEQTFTTTKTVWAGLKTAKGRQMFYTTNLDKAVTHIFYIRSIDGLTQESWIDYSGELYDIVDIENLDERDEWMAVYCNVRGSDSAAVNYA